MRGDRRLRGLALGAAILAAATVPVAAPASAARTLHLGDVFRITGYAARPAQGTVVVRGRWGSGPYQLITTTRTDKGGRYAFAVKATRRGLWTIQIEPPDHQTKQFVLRVV